MANSRTGLALALAALAAALTWTGCGSGSDGGCVAVAEACNGVDDDCDGAVDEGYDVGAACTAGVGACAASGVRICLAGAAACDAVPGEPAAETCDQVDEDCDGETDEGVVGCCTPAAVLPCGSDLGACEMGTTTCSATGAWGPCLGAGAAPVLLPGADAETCNGIDDDCDGATDDEVVAPGCALQSGVCAAATETCDGANGWLCTYPPQFEEAEATCDDLDNDCDGQTDEGLLATWYRDLDGDTWGTPGITTAACTASAGYVGRAGDCNDAQAAVNPGAAERCNGIDDDCDGQTDEQPTDATIGTLCDGVDGDQCMEGAITCAGGTLVCSDSTGTTVELCDALDNDCDGQTDEGWTVGEACLVGVGECVRPGQQACRADGSGVECVGVPGTPAPEVCDGKDNDCDGQTDEELAAAAPLCAKQAGVCAGSRQACGGAAGWLACDNARYASYAPAYQPVEAGCDGLDNDCDGQTDFWYCP